MGNKKFNLCEISKDGVTPYEICAAKWNIESLKELICAIDKKDSEENEKYSYENRDNFFNINVLKNGLVLAIEEGNNVDSKDLTMLDLIINQIKIQYVVDSSNFF